MDLSKLNLSNLSKAFPLLEKRESLIQQLEALEKQVVSILGGTAVSASASKSSRPAKSSGKRGKKAGRSKTSAKKTSRKGASLGRRGAVKEGIMEILTKAGSAGASAKEISAKLNLPPQNVHVWFSTTGRKIKSIVKKGPGHWVLK